MAIAFAEEKKRQKRLLAVFVILLLATAGILVWWFVRKNSPIDIASQALLPSYRRVDIDLKILESQTLKDLEVFEGIKPFEGEVGRENPFLPY